MIEGDDATKLSWDEYIPLIPIKLLGSPPTESKNALNTNTGKNGAHALSSIALYIPPNALKTQYTADWQGLEGGALRAAAGGAISDLISGGGLYANDITDFGVKGMGTFLWEGLKSAGVGFMGKAARQLEKTTGFLSASHGIAVNNHLALTYRGVSKFREHTFTFNFFPKNNTDAGKIRELLKDFRNGMLPRMCAGDMEAVMQKGNRLSKPFFSSPRHWTIEFFVPGMDSESQFFFKIGKSVITSMDVNYSINTGLTVTQNLSLLNITPFNRF